MRSFTFTFPVIHDNHDDDDDDDEPTTDTRYAKPKQD